MDIVQWSSNLSVSGGRNGAAINDIFNAGDSTGFVGYEKADQVSNFLGPVWPAQWDPAKRIHHRLPGIVLTDAFAI